MDHLKTVKGQASSSKFAEQINLAIAKVRAEGPLLIKEVQAKISTPRKPRKPGKPKKISQKKLNEMLWAAIENMDVPGAKQALDAGADLCASGGDVNCSVFEQWKMACDGDASDQKAAVEMILWLESVHAPLLRDRSGLREAHEAKKAGGAKRNKIRAEEFKEWMSNGWTGFESDQEGLVAIAQSWAGPGGEKAWSKIGQKWVDDALAHMESTHSCYEGLGILEMGVVRLGGKIEKKAWEKFTMALKKNLLDTTDDFQDENRVSALIKSLRASPQLKMSPEASGVWMTIGVEMDSLDMLEAVTNASSETMTVMPDEALDFFEHRPWVSEMRSRSERISLLHFAMRSQPRLNCKTKECHLGDALCALMSVPEAVEEAKGRSCPWVLRDWSLENIMWLEGVEPRLLDIAPDGSNFAHAIALSDPPRFADMVRLLKTSHAKLVFTEDAMGRTPAQMIIEQGRQSMFGEMHNKVKSFEAKIVAWELSELKKVTPKMKKGPAAPRRL